MGAMSYTKKQHIIARIFAIFLLIIQGASLDYFMMAENEPAWFAFLVTDIIVLFVWLAIMYMSYKKSRSGSNQGYDDMKWVYIAWLVYSVHIIPQVATIFKTLPSKLTEDDGDIFGPTMLKVILCITPLLFLCVMYSHHDAKPHSRRKYYLEKLIASVALDLFDSVEMMEYLFDQDSITVGYVDAILAFSCLNIFLPTFALYELRYNKFRDSGEVPSISFKLFYIISLLLIVDVPYFVIRVCLWKQFKMRSSVLIAKNVLAIILSVLELIEYFGEYAPKKCKYCLHMFTKEHHGHHEEKCGVAMENQIALKEVEAIKS